MMFRCMSESEKGDKNGYIADLNTSRVLNTMLDYNFHNKELTIEEKIVYLIENNLINIDSDLFEGKDNKTKLIEKLMNIWKSDPINNFKRLLDNIKKTIIILDNDDQRTLNEYIILSGKNSSSNKSIKFDENVDQMLPKGRCVKKVNKGKEQKKVISLTKDILPYIIPLSCILTIQDTKKNFIEMLEVIKNNDDLTDIFHDQTKIWWNNNNILTYLVPIIKRYVKKNSDI